MRKKLLKIGILSLLAVAVVIFITYDLRQYATLEYIKSQHEAMLQYYNKNIALVFIVFGITYILVTAFSLPAATILTLLAGALFGFIPGLIVASFASSIGATCAFVMARFILQDSVQEKYGRYLVKINEGFAREGLFYLFALRLTPIVPFFIVNIVTAILPIRVWSFYWVSQLGMLAGTAVYVYAGTELSKISSLSDVASPTLLISFTLIGLFPIAAKKAVEIFRRRRGHA